MKLLYLRCILAVIVLMSSSAFSQSLKSDSINVTHYSINLDIIHLSQKKIAGYTDVYFTPTAASLRVLALDLLKMNIDSVKINGSTQAVGVNYNDTLLKIALPTVLLSGDTATARIYYHGQPLIESGNWGGFHFLNDSSLAFNLAVAFVDSPHTYGRVWHPCIDEFTSRSTYDFFIRSKDDKTVVCSGTLVSISQEAGGTKLSHWRLNQSIPSYLAGIAIGNFVVVSDTFIGSSGKIPMDIYCKASDTSRVKGSFVNLSHMMSIYENRFGPYRFDRVGFVLTTLGAMEHATNIALPAHTVNGSTTYEWLYAHELSHHWFGNMVTCATAEDMWLNEGWAVFSEQIFMEGMYGWEAYKKYSRENHESILSKLHTTGSDGSYMAVYGIPHQHTYSRTVYDKGASVAHSLRGYLGDSIFFPAIRAYLDSFAFNSASTFQFRDFLSAYTGQNLNPWFDAWVFSPGFIQYGIDSVKTFQLGSGYASEVWVKQKLKGPAQYCQHNRIEVYFLDPNLKVHSRLMEFTGNKGSEVFILDFIPLAIMLNIEEKILDASTSQYRYIAQTGITDFTTEKFRLEVSQISDTAFVRVTHNWVAPDPLKSFVPRLILSDNRYWTIEGHFPQGFSANGRFNFGKFNYLDPVLLADPKDSLVILYRENAGEEWQGVPFTRSGSPVVGFLSVENIKPGQYTLAVWDDNPVGIEKENPTEKIKSAEIYPNPAQDRIYFKKPEGATSYKIIDSSGIVRQSDIINESQNVNIAVLPAGTYLMAFYNNKGKQVASAKFIKIVK